MDWKWWNFIPVLPLPPPIVLDDTCSDFKLHIAYKVVSCRALKPYLTSIILEKHHKFLVRMSDLYTWFIVILSKRGSSPPCTGGTGGPSLHHQKHKTNDRDLSQNSYKDIQKRDQLIHGPRISVSLVSLKCFVFI